MASKTSKTMGVRLSNEVWAEVEHAAALRGRTRNEEIAWRIAQHAIELPRDDIDGQTTIWDVLGEDGGVAAREG